MPSDKLIVSGSLSRGAALGRLTRQVEMKMPFSLTRFSEAINANLMRQAKEKLTTTRF